MTNTTLLRQKIDESGYKLQFLAEKCGLTYYGLMKKVNNETEFKASEIKVLKELLKLTNEEANKIFLPKKVDKLSTNKGVKQDDIQ